MKNQDQKMTELSSDELLEMFQVEELDDRLEMCWVNCNTVICTINSDTTNGTCCRDQEAKNGDIGISIPIGGGGDKGPNEK
jgi:hypothetical protein